MKSTVNVVEMRVSKWFDFKLVTLTSPVCVAQSEDITENFSKQDNYKISISRYNVVKQYNTFMDDVDLLDRLISYHRIYNISQKLYLRSFFHFVDMGLVNA